MLVGLLVGTVQQYRYYIINATTYLLGCGLLFLRNASKLQNTYMQYKRYQTFKMYTLFLSN